MATPEQDHEFEERMSDAGRYFNKRFTILQEQQRRNHPGYSGYRSIKEEKDSDEQPTESYFAQRAASLRNT